MKSYNKAIISTMLALMIIATFSAAIVAAADPTPPPPPPDPDATPTPPPPPPSGGGSYSPPVSAPAAFQPYTVELKSGDGSAVGTLTGLDYFLVRLAAARNATLDNESFSLAVAADLSSRPEQATFDISLGGEGDLPEGMRDVDMLVSAVVSGKSAYGWSFKDGSRKLTFTLPASKLDNASATCYLVCYDGNVYQVIKANVSVGNGTVTVEAPVPGLWGKFTVVTARSLQPVATPEPTPEPTATPAPTPTPTPVPEPAGVTAYVPMIATFVAGLAIGAVALLILTRFI
jgi:hypothetical protein